MEVLVCRGAGEVEQSSFWKCSSCYQQAAEGCRFLIVIVIIIVVVVRSSNNSIIVFAVVLFVRYEYKTT